MKKTALLSIIFMLFAVGVRAELVHRYSFTSGADDSVGSAHGTLQNGATVADGQVILDGTDDYVDLPGSEIAVNTYPALTVELWMTQPEINQSYSMSAAFGGTWDNGLGRDYLMISTTRGEEVSKAAIAITPDSDAPWSDEVGISGPELNDGLEHHYVVTLNASEIAYYIDGVLQGTAAISADAISGLSAEFAYLGKGVYLGDGTVNGSINEYRIHNLAYDAAMVQSSYASGPDQPAAMYAVPSNPSPQDGGVVGGLRPVLRWQSDPSADIIAHRVYLDTDAAAVQTATPSSSGIYRATLSPAGNSYTPAADLEMDRTYYWRIEEVTLSGYRFSGPLWGFRTRNLKAHAPTPADGAAGMALSNVTLQWQPGEDAVGHRILFGDSPATLEVVESDYASTSYALASLSPGTTYYWRVDERYADMADVTGDLWSFSTVEGVSACVPGDLDGNCLVDLVDLVLFAEDWLQSIVCQSYDCPDLDRDQVVGMGDLAVFAEHWHVSGEPMVVINEIHYHPDSNTEEVEFVELYNAGAMAVDLDGWSLDGGIEYTFTGKVLLGPGAYLVVSENPADVQSRFGVTSYGPFEGSLSNEGEAVALRDDTGEMIDEVDYGCDFPWPTAANGEGASMELIHPAIDNNLAGSWRSSGYHHTNRPELAFGLPTPGMVNSIYAIAAPPQIRQVSHTPEQPKSAESITVSAKVTDPDGVQGVTLWVQVVAPGAYIPAYLPIGIASLLNNPYQMQPLNPAFEDAANWIQIPMLDNGAGADAAAGDGVYTAVIPAQNHRTLVRYRIVADDGEGQSIRVPYADDGSLNFACFVYDGVPPYVVSGDTSVHPEAQAGSSYVYSPEVLTSIPVYTLITRDEDLYQCGGYNEADRIDQGSTSPQVQDAGRAYNWEGAFVYDGKVYDHIGYRLRGGNGRYNYGMGGKRSMKLRFNRGNYFQARDLSGEKLPSKWQHLNTGKMFGNQLVSGYRNYPYGLNEILNYRLFDLANVPSPLAWWVHFRTITGAQEAPGGTNGQYQGDFWGMHIVFENYDGAFLDRLGLPKGNFYKLSDKIYDGARQLRYQGPEAVTNAADYENIRWNLNYGASADFIHNYLDCDEWFRYHTVTEAIRHYDVFSGPTCIHCLKNMAWYFYPDYDASNQNLGKLWFVPFDVDDTWGPYWNQGVDHAKGAIYDQEYTGGLTQRTIQPAKAPIKQEYRNYIREFRDLLWQPEVINPMIDELAAVIADFVHADRDRWRQDTTVGSPIDNGTLETGVAIMKQFAWDGGYWTGSNWPGSDQNLDNLANAEGDLAALPNTPTVSYIGSAGYPVNDLRFQTSAFGDPQGSGTFAALEWRIAEHDLSTSEPPSNTLELVGKNEIWRYFKGTEEASNPRDAWRQNGFNDEEWLSGQTSIGFADNDDNTVLTDMQNRYTSVYLRKTFEVTNLSRIESLTLQVYVDDGCIITVNGAEVARLYCSGGEKYYDSLTDATHHEASGYEQVILLPPYSYLVQGDNVIAVHALQSSTGSSDFSIDATLAAELAESTEPTPTPTSVLSKHKYEINPLWESGEITTPGELTVQIPGGLVRPERTYRVRCRMKDTSGRWSHWSAPVEFAAGAAIGSDLLNYLRVSEVMYNPAPDPSGMLDNDEFEFLELKNISDTVTLDLSTVSVVDGITFAFAGSAVTTLGPGEHVLLVQNRTAFESRYPGLGHRIAGEFDGKLNNDGETVEIMDTWNGTIVAFTYNDGIGWPQAADGAGHSLVPAAWWAMEDQHAGILDIAGNWRRSQTIGGSPGADDPEPATGLVINEILAHTDFNDPAYPDYDSNDWIELYNAADAPVALDGHWYLSDDGDDLKKWALPAGTVSAKSWVSYDEISGFHQPITSGFGLDKAGETLFLSYLPGTAADAVIDCVRFNGQANGISLGRYPDGSPYRFRMSPTRGIVNDVPLASVVLSEVMYHPDETTAADEYIELYNPTASAIALYSPDGAGPWRLDNAVSYTFPAGMSLAAGARLVIVPFDPSDAALLGAFETEYSCDLTAGVNVVGPWSGSLSNGGERLALEMPQDSDDPLDPLAISWILIDQVSYSDYDPWPVAADGQGYSLTRRYPDDPGYSGDDASGWKAATPTPGE